MNAFKVLRMMMNDMSTQIDRTMFRRFVLLLSGANLV